MKSPERQIFPHRENDHLYSISCIFYRPHPLNNLCHSYNLTKTLVIEILWQPKSKQTKYNAWSQNLFTTHGHRNWLKPKGCSRSQDLVQQRPQITYLSYMSQKTRIAEQGHSRKQSRQYVTKQGQTLLVNNKKPYMCMAIIKNLLHKVQTTWRFKARS